MDRCCALLRARYEEFWPDTEMQRSKEMIGQCKGKDGLNSDEARFGASNRGQVRL